MNILVFYLPISSYQIYIRNVCLPAFIKNTPKNQAEKRYWILGPKRPAIIIIPNEAAL
jgi:hypothetical protein